MVKGRIAALRLAKHLGGNWLCNEGQRQSDNGLQVKPLILRECRGLSYGVYSHLKATGQRHPGSAQLVYTRRTGGTISHCTGGVQMALLQRQGGGRWGGIYHWLSVVPGSIETVRFSSLSFYPQPCHVGRS